MTNRVVVALALLGAFALPLSAAANDIGVGLAAGEPSGLAFSLVRDEGYGIAAVAGWSLADPQGPHLHIDYVMGDRLGAEGRGSPIYNGIGVRFQLYDDAVSRLIGIRFPMGLLFPAKHRRFDLFIEVVPIIDLVPEIDVVFTGGLGMRFYFGGGAT